MTLTITNLIKKLDGEVTRLNPTVVPAEMLRCPHIQAAAAELMLFSLAFSPLEMLIIYDRRQRH